jgi:CspA family cold shock protein
MASRAISGQVRWFNESKGFGFIRRDDTAEDVLVHRSSFKDAGLGGITAGEEVSFEVVDGKDGARAINVVPRRNLDPAT